MTSLYTKFITSCVFPLHEKLKKHDTVAIKNAMEKSQWWSREQLLTYQNERLQKLLKSVNAHVPYYQRLFAENPIDINRIKSAADLPQLPFLTKPVIREHSDNLKADNATGLARFNTGGSSGEPLVFYISNERVSHDVAARWRATRWWDVDIGDPEIVLWGSPIELGSQDYVRLVRDKLLRTKLLPAFEMTEAKLDSFIENIKAWRPKMLFGYPSAFALLAKHAAARNVLLKDLGIKVVFVTSERLYDHQREMIETAFGCQVANGYGGRDAGFIAHQCPSGSLHITSEDIIVEIVDEQGDVLPVGVRGEIVVTHLATQHYPFIRYKTGDVGVLSDEVCSCGRGLPVLAEIEGRTTDFIVAQDGTLMHGLALIYIVRDLDGVEQFKIVQESREKMRVQVVVNSAFDDKKELMIKSGFKQRLGEQVEIVIEKVAEISAERSGKMRYVVSHAV
jgi:phenylacetate-coenzyme A ligase PaaK-like adenylate-forming protein